MRLQRVGRKHEPSFRLVLTDSKNSTKSGRSEEVLGAYDPRKSTDAFKTDRIKHWLSQGIALTPTVNNLLIKHRIITGKKIDVSAVSKKATVATPELTTNNSQPTTEVVEEPTPTPEPAPEPVAIVEEVAPEAPVAEEVATTPEPEVAAPVEEQSTAQRVEPLEDPALDATIEPEVK
ncbi:MAG: 30S ribosomal protein S16 [bacterium]|nr:30S ribosomal protein S16 [bacterium]